MTATWLFLIVGLIIGAGLLWLVPWLRNRDIALKWHEWLIGIVGFLLLLFAIQNFFETAAEGESSAGMYLLVMGLPALILLAVTWLLVARRQRA